MNNHALMLFELLEEVPKNPYKAHGFIKGRRAKVGFYGF